MYPKFIYFGGMFSPFPNKSNLSKFIYIYKSWKKQKQQFRDHITYKIYINIYHIVMYIVGLFSVEFVEYVIKLEE